MLTVIEETTADMTEHSTPLHQHHTHPSSDSELESVESVYSESVYSEDRMD